MMFNLWRLIPVCELWYVCVLWYMRVICMSEAHVYICVHICLCISIYICRSKYVFWERACSREYFDRCCLHTANLPVICRRDHDGGDQIKETQSFPPMCVCVRCQLHSDRGKQTDYLVCTNTSERAVRRCDDKSWQGASQLKCTKCVGPAPSVWYTAFLWNVHALLVRQLSAFEGCEKMNRQRRKRNFNKSTDLQPDADILSEAIKELPNRTIAGAATFLIKGKAHWGKKKPTFKQAKLFQAKIFPGNGMTGQIKQTLHSKSLAGQEVTWSMKIESSSETAGYGLQLAEDQQKRRCASSGIVWQELGNKLSNKDDEFM